MESISILFDPSKLEPTLLTEYLCNGSLKEVLDKERRCIADSNWNPTKKCICLIGIADAMRCLHEHGILHSDLKPANILIGSNHYPRVCDFGLSRCLSSATLKTLVNKALKGIRPEFTSDVPDKTKDLITRCWSRDVEERPTFKEIFEMLTNDFSFSSESVEEDEIRDFIEMLETKDEEKRKLQAEVDQLKEKYEMTKSA